MEIVRIFVINNFGTEDGRVRKMCIMAYITYSYPSFIFTTHIHLHYTLTSSLHTIISSPPLSHLHYTLMYFHYKPTLPARLHSKFHHSLTYLHCSSHFFWVEKNILLSKM